MDPDSKLPGWIRIRIQNPDPDPAIEIEQDFHLFLKMIRYLPNKSSLLNKIGTYLPTGTFLVEDKNFSQNFVNAFAQMCFLPGFGSGIRIGKIFHNPEIRNTA